MMKLFGFLLLLIMLFPSSVSAHQYKDNVNSTILMHIEPDDVAYAKELVTVHFRIDSTQQELMLDDCICEIEIKRNNKIIERKALDTVEKGEKIYYNMVSGVVFPKEGVYEVSIIGRSKTNTFANFDSSFVVRVEKSEAEKSQEGSAKAATRNAVYVLFSGALIFLVLILVFKLLQSKKSS